MKPIYLPAGTEHVQYSDLARLIAVALFPLKDGATDSELMAQGVARLNLETELAQAVKSGALPVKDPSTYGPHPWPVGNLLMDALVTVDDLRLFLNGRPVFVELEPAAHVTEAEAPAVGASGGGAVPAPDPERRLARLRALGGNATFSNRQGEWKFTGIKALVDAERNEGRKRRDEKTIRADLREAAEAEREAKRAGPFDGLTG